MKLKNALLVFVVVIILILFSVYITIDHIKAKDVLTTEFDFYASQGKRIGFNLDPDKLHFGIVCQGCGARRDLIIENQQPFREKVEFYIAIADERDFEHFSISFPFGQILESGEEGNFTATLSVSSDAEIKKYEGAIITKTYKAWPWEESIPIYPEWKTRGCFSERLWEIIHCKAVAIEKARRRKV